MSLSEEINLDAFVALEKAEARIRELDTGKAALQAALVLAGKRIGEAKAILGKIYADSGWYMMDSQKREMREAIVNALAALEGK